MALNMPGFHGKSRATSHSPVVAWAMVLVSAAAGGCSRTDGADSPSGMVASPIIDGTAATEGQIASAVALLDAKTGELLCSGTLLAPTVVVSAAHCVAIEDLTTHAIHEKAPGEILVVAGALDATAATPDQRHEIAGIIRHPGYPGPISDMDPDGLGKEDDLCLLLLKSPITSLHVVEVPPLRKVDGLLHEKTPLTIAGYGTRDLMGTLAGELYVAQTPFQRANESEFLAGGKGSPDTCRGDSGGPVYVTDAGETYLVGAASRGTISAVALCGEGGIYTLLPAYTAWMQDASEGGYTAPIDDGVGGGGGGSDPEQSGGCSAGGAPRAWDPSLFLGLAVAWMMAKRRGSAR